MYDNIKSLRLVKEGSQTLVTAMISSEGEVMEFRRSGRYISSPGYPVPPPLDEHPGPHPICYAVRLRSGQSSIQLHALIANFKIELFYGIIVCWLALAGQFL